MQTKKAGVPDEERLSPKPLDEREWIVMFVDIEGSTRLKYQQLSQNKWHFRDIVMGLMEVVQDAAQARATKFTGDGAMVVFPSNNRKGCVEAIEAAEKIIQGVDRTNFNFAGAPHIHIRIGIATGVCAKVGGTLLELSGRPADLAARLCSEADRDGVLVDKATKKAFEKNHALGKKKTKGRFQPCDRRLMLKGVPLKPDPGPFWHYKVRRLVQSAEVDYSSKGLVAVYLDRLALDKDFPEGVMTWINRAPSKSSIFVAGRTLIKWAEKQQQLLSSKKELKFYFLLSLPKSWGFLDKEEKRVVRIDYKRALQKFRKLARLDKSRFHFAHTPHLILDGVTFARIIFPGGAKHQPNGRLVALQDVNVFRPSGNSGQKDGDAQQSKVTLFWVCTCGQQNSKGGASCTAHGLLRRTLQFWHELPKPELFSSRTY